MRIHTRSNLSPNGKQRVLYAAHPADIQAYEEPYAKLILDRNNCVVEVLEDEGDDTAALGELVRNSQLVMIPVTERFLSEANRASRALDIAIQNSVPALLIQEAELKSSDDWERFNRVCHKLQALNPRQDSEDRLSFEQKLSDFVNGALADDALLERVRLYAFDGHLFISYRKNDHRHVKPLMQAIHSLPECEGLSLWYDEYLPVGRDFEDSIVRNMEDSELLLLIVTPRINESGNYVMSEYQMAKAQGIDVLPVEMEPTDRETVAQLYPGIGSFCTLDSTALIRKRLEGLKREQKVPIGEQLYLLGIAYLKGINVEKDVSRGTALLERAIYKHFYRPAGRMLVSMYRYGTDVPRDIVKAQPYSEAVSGSYMPITPEFLQSPLYFEFVEDKCEHCSLLIEAGKSDLAIRWLLDVYGEARGFMAEKQPGAEKLCYKALTLYRAACESLGRYQEANRYMQEELALEARLYGASYRSLSLRQFRRQILSAGQTLYRAKVQEGQALCGDVMNRLSKFLAEANRAGDESVLQEAYRLHSACRITALELEYYRYGQLDEVDSRLGQLELDLAELLKEQREEAEVYDLARRIYRLWGKCLSADKRFPEALERYKQAQEYARQGFELEPCVQSEMMWIDACLDTNNAAIYAGTVDNFGLLIMQAKLGKIYDRLKEVAYNHPDMKSILAKYHLVSETIYLIIEETTAAAVNQSECYRFAQAAVELRQNPEDLLTCIFSLDRLSRADPSIPRRMTLERLLKLTRALRSDFPENQSYLDMERYYVVQLATTPGDTAPQPDPEEYASVYQQMTQHPVSIPRMLTLRDLARDLADLKKENPADTRFERLYSQVKDTLNQDIDVLLERARDLGFSEGGNAAQQKERVDESVSIYDALLQLFPNNDALLQERRMVLTRYHNRFRH